MGVLLAGAAVASAAQKAVPTPADVYGELFEQVQLKAIFPDSKSFVDALPNRPPEQILDEYRELSNKPGFDLKKFVAERFSPPPSVASDFHTVAGQDVRQHIGRTPRACPCLIDTSCRAAASTKSITGTRTSPCRAWRRAAGTT
jgi:alpha,alpha-trehalase